MRAQQKWRQLLSTHQQGISVFIHLYLLQQIRIHEERRRGH